MVNTTRGDIRDELTQIEKTQDFVTQVFNQLTAINRLKSLEVDLKAAQQERELADKNLNKNRFNGVATEAARDRCNAAELNVTTCERQILCLHALIGHRTSGDLIDAAIKMLEALKPNIG